MLVYPSPIPSLVEGDGEDPKTLISKVRGEPACPQQEAESSLHYPSGSAISLVQLKNRMLLLTRQLLGEPLWGHSPG